MRTCPTEVNSSGFWAQKDFAAVVRHVSDANAGLPLTVIGSSIGGRTHHYILSPYTPMLIIYVDLMTLFPDEWPSITRFLSVCGGMSYGCNREILQTMH